MTALWHCGPSTAFIVSLPGVNLRRRILIHRGDRPFRTEDEIDVWPVSTFLEALETGEMWP